VRLSQVLANLLTNAAKYTPPGGSIRLQGRHEDETVVLRVIDNGIGIAPEVLPRIFEMFSQGRSERQHAEGGLGIGLALVRGLLELHGGTIEARSAGVGRGSEFIVRVPVGDDGLTVDALLATGAALAPASDAVKVLIADDNRDAADSLAILLRGDGHDIRKAYDGTAALETAQEFRPDVALLDIGMPGLDGYEVAQRIREEPWGQGVTLVALTGWGQAQDKERAMAAGFDHHVTKPVEPERLQALLASAGGSRASRAVP
jgi:CheY-like chemotaxis protein